MRTVTPDWRPEGPTRIPGALGRIHLERGAFASCAIGLCDDRRSDEPRPRLSLHHIYDRSDLWQNLEFVCGSGTTGCHGALTAENELARAMFGNHLAENRPDVVAYVLLRAGEVAGRDWFRRRLFLDVP